MIPSFFLEIFHLYTGSKKKSINERRAEQKRQKCTNPEIKAAHVGARRTRMEHTTETMQYFVTGIVRQKEMVRTSRSLTLFFLTEKKDQVDAK